MRESPIERMTRKFLHIIETQRCTGGCPEKNLRQLTFYKEDTVLVADCLEGLGVGEGIIPDDVPSWEE
jgi:hypothetical protein